ncbi:MAG: ABC transporter ATP-binding protein [Gammaproteobacteria bacterium]|nr:ABC transporter ATP-binding protein [Gammaproteobacteria bacterium]MDD9799682.1 ABC transporter ATP-binding protein [Gammaproteobacteria bacterium]MDD9814494.1 ABC transporter ATP-binding protein [Gammaproteobacteria bacterium]MDD9850223.1 ABC transporter ATP-binding protein [Gammaproteobacteria bacterium]MDD9871833.1 ABC transporter ATP-binding protein [Gammaproteobacteria bacterium]
MLELKGVTKRFGGVQAVNGLDISVAENEIFGLIGPNGSGKSTTVNLICGIYPVTAGEIVFNGKNLAGLPPHKRLRAGIARTFQNIRLFPNLTVWQNLLVARNSMEDVHSQSFLARWLGETRHTRGEIESILEFSDLADKADDLASNLAFGEQRRLELARAAAAKPRLLLLDEPAAGMNREEVQDLIHRVRGLRDSGITILLVEHVMQLVMNVTDRICVINFGQKIAQGTPDEIQNHSAVQEAYFGTTAGDPD